MAGGSIVAGIIGGLGPEATIYYYRGVLSECMRRCGRRPRLAIYSIPIEEMCRAARSGDARSVGGLVAEAIEALAAAGAGVAVLAANTPHLAWGLFSKVAERVKLRLIHIAEPVASWVSKHSVRTVGLVATSGTIRHRVYHDILGDVGVEVIEPPPPLQAEVDNAIEDLAMGRGGGGLSAIERAVDWLAQRSDAVVLGCTDISPYKEAMHLRASVPVIDSSDLHVSALVSYIEKSSGGL